MWVDHNKPRYYSSSVKKKNCEDHILQTSFQSAVQIHDFHGPTHISLTWWDCQVGVQNSGKMSLKFCIIIESNSQKNFFAIVLYTNMAAVTSRENREYDLTIFGNLYCAHRLQVTSLGSFGFFTSPVSLTASFIEDDPERETTRSLHCHTIGHVAPDSGKIVNWRVKSGVIYMPTSSRDVMAAMLVSPTNPPGIELYSYAEFFLWFWLKNKLKDHVSENTLLYCSFFKWHSTTTTSNSQRLMRRRVRVQKLQEVKKK